MCRNIVLIQIGSRPTLRVAVVSCVRNEMTHRQRPCSKSTRENSKMSLNRSARCASATCLAICCSYIKQREKKRASSRRGKMRQERRPVLFTRIPRLWQFHDDAIQLRAWPLLRTWFKYADYATQKVTLISQSVSQSANQSIGQSIMHTAKQ